jgi:methyl-accepting chemotaxis protein
MTIRIKILLSLGLLISIIASQFFYIHIVDKQKLNLLTEINFTHKATVHIGEIAIEGQKLRRYEKEYFIYIENIEKREKYMREWTSAHQSLQSKLVAIDIDDSGIWATEDKSNAGQWSKASNTYYEVMTNLNIQVKNGSINGTLKANSAIKDGKNAFRLLLNGTEKLLQDKLIRSNILLKQYNELVNKSNIVLLLMFSVGVFFALILIIFVPERINSQILKLEQAVSNISKGALNSPVPKVHSPELASLAKSIERMRITTRGLLQRLQTKKTREK